jgi:para-aminobenzoate synthetase component 1
MALQEVDISVAPADLLQRCAAEPLAFVLDGGGPDSWTLGRALLGFRPSATLRVGADGGAIIRSGDHTRVCSGDPFALLECFRREHVAPGGGAFDGGLVVALSYDLRRWIERSPGRAPDPLGLPVLHAAAYDWLLSYCYRERRYHLASARCSEAQMRALAEQLRGYAAVPAAAARRRGGAPPRPDLSREQYCAAVAAALDYIAAGDVYQVNLAQRFVVEDAPSPGRLFVALQRHPMPFAAYLDGGDFVLLSNSPECFLSVSGANVATFPIKGTRPRGADPHDDRVQVRALQESAKDRAEHIMIVDLERSDLGRVCRTGSVRVDELARVRSFPSLHHIVSAVRGELAPGVTLAEVLRATFPGGSITGAPKIRAMEIIDELEPVARGFYTGAIGYIGADGSAVFSLLIRTAIAARGGVTYHAGGGIVADSVAMREYEETLLKSRPFFAALAAA